MNLVYPFAAVIMGMVIAAQAPINSAAVGVLGSPVAAAVISVAITLSSLLLVLPLFGGTVHPSAVLGLPWWIVFGGLAGALIVAGSVAIVPVTGVALFVVCMIAGQLVASAVLDHVGAFGMVERPVSMLKLVGLFVVGAGALMVRAG